MKTTWQRAEFLFTLLIVLVVGSALWTSLSWSRRAGMFPWIVIGLTLPILLWQLLDDARGKTAPPSEAMPLGEDGSSEAHAVVSADKAKRGLIIVGWILVFLALIFAFGFAIGGSVAAILCLRFGYHERWRTCIIYAVVMYLMLEVVFRQTLTIPFPVGALFEALDIVPQVDLGIRI